jgi:Divergent InlB B-repeat domain
MRRLTRLLVVAAAVVLFAAGSNAGANDRTTSDQPDEQIGPQVHLVYAVPAGGADRGLDTNGTIAGWVNDFNDWLSIQTGGVRIRIDTFQGQPDITFLPLKETDAQLDGMGQAAPAQIFGELSDAGLNDPQKRYLVIEEGSDNFGWCGFSYLNSEGVVFLDSCDYTSWMDALVGHEMFHLLGAVNTCAPHAVAPGEVGDDPNDLMSFYVPTLGTAKLDPGNDDYWGPPGDDNLPASCPDNANVADSDYLTSHPFFPVQVTAGAGGEVTLTLPDESQSCSAGTPCSATVRTGTTLTLSATPDANEHFVGWSGACGAAAECTPTVTGPLTLSAAFAPDPILALKVAGSGHVDVVGYGERCARRCSYQLGYEQTTALKETPSKGWRFKGWAGICHGAKQTCRVNLRQRAALTAVFAKLKAKPKPKR